MDVPLLERLPWLVVLVKQPARRLRPIWLTIKQNPIKFIAYLVLSICVASLASRLLGDNFDAANQKFKGPPTARKARQASYWGSSSSDKQPAPGVDPFASRPRIETRNGHLILQASPDKNIDFKTSGSRGSITVNGYKLDQLVGVAKALERSGRLATGAFDTASGNDSSLAQGEQYELVLRSLFGSANKLKDLQERANLMEDKLKSARNELKILRNRVAKKSSKVNKIGKQVEEIATKLKQNDCFEPQTGQPVCKNGGTCLDLYDSYKCLCPKEFEGAKCELDVDECQKFRGTDLGCQNGGTCVNQAGGYRCECPPQFHGIHCTEQHDDCSMATSNSLCGHGKCLNLARTQANQPSFECICDQGWTRAPGGLSPACVVDVNECLAGQSLLASSNGTYSVLSELNMNMGVPAGPTSAYPCSQNPYVECINLPGSFQCGPCPAGYQGNGRVCRDIDECQRDNGGCSKSPLVECVNLPGGRRCGPCPPGYQTQDDSQTCQRVSACQQEPNGGCHAMATCVELAGVANRDLARLCVCQYPFVGGGVGPFGCQLGDPLAQLPVPGLQDNATQSYGNPGPNLPLVNVKLEPQDYCHPNPCLNGGECSLVVSTSGLVDSKSSEVECICPLGWRGGLCETPETQLECGSVRQASRGLLEFPVGGSFESLLKLAQDAKLNSVASKQRSPGSDLADVAAATGQPQISPRAPFQCAWSLMVPGADMAIKLNFSHLLAEPDKSDKLQPKYNHKLQVFNFADVHRSPKAAAQPLPGCSESLEVLERFQSSVEEATGQRGRLLARVCSLLMPPTEPATSSHPPLTLQTDSNAVELVYSLGMMQANKASTPTIRFHLHWTRTEAPCGGQLPVQESGSISSPNFPEFYAAGVECRYLLRVPSGKRIRIQFGELNLLTPSRPDPEHCADSLTILDGGLNFDRPTLFRHCANQAAGSSWQQRMNTSGSGGVQLVSSSSTVEVVLLSKPDSSMPLMRPKQKRGFYLTYASEPSEPSCGGLYTARTGVIKSDDYQELTVNGGAISQDLSSDDAPLEYEFAHYFDFKVSASASHSPGSSFRPWLIGGSMGHSTPRPSSMLGKLSGFANSATSNGHGTYTRCEFEIRPADQARHHHVQVDWLEMACDWPRDSMGSLAKWSRYFRCHKSRLMIFNRPPGSLGGGGGNETDPTKRQDSQLLATFCAGDKYNSSLPQLKPLVSEGHALYIVYEGYTSNDDESTPSSSASKKAHSSEGERQMEAAGFKLRYKTICSAVYRSLESFIETNLDMVGECLYHIQLPPNNTISLVIEPAALESQDQSSQGSLAGADSSQANNLASLRLPDGSCAAQAIFMDGAVPRGPLALAQTERQLRTFDFSSATTFGTSDTSASPSTSVGTEDPQQQRVGTSSSTRTSSTGFNPMSAGESSSPQAESTLTAANTESQVALQRNSYWQYGSSRAHDIKEFDVCNLPSLGIDSTWNEMSLMFRLNPKLNSKYADSMPNAGQQIKFVIKYQAESACGGVISEPQHGTLDLIAQQPIDQLGSYPITVNRYEQLHKLLFVSHCAWILRNPRVNQPIRLSFQLARQTREEIKRRRSEWIKWLRNLRQAAAVSSQTTTTTAKPKGDPFGWGSGWSGGYMSGEEPEVEDNEVQTQKLLVANCSQAFQELIELYEPSSGRSRVICPSELLDGSSSTAAAHWTTMSDTVHIRLLNETHSQANQSSPTPAPVWSGRKPLPGPPIKLAYVMQSHRDDFGACGGRLFQSSGTLQTPRYPFNYAPYADCVWLIQAPTADQQLRLNFTRFHLESSVDCHFDYLEIRNGPSADSPLMGRFCSKQLQSRILLAQSSSLRLHFHSDAHLNMGGFQVHFDAAQTGCGGFLSASSGQIDSPNYPYAYAQSADCEWTIEVSESNRILLKVVDLDLSGPAGSRGAGGEGAALAAADQQQVDDLLEEARASKLSDKSKQVAPPLCQMDGPNADYLEIFDSDDELKGRSLGRWCHLSQLRRARFKSSSNRLHIVYHAQALDQGRGFRLTYATDCSYEQELMGVSGIIESPGYPSEFHSAASSGACSWVVRAPLGSNISVAITEYETNEPSALLSDFEGLFDFLGPGSDLGSATTITTTTTSTRAPRKEVAPNSRASELRQLGGETASCPNSHDLSSLRFWSVKVAAVAGQNGSATIQSLQAQLDPKLAKALERRLKASPNSTSFDFPRMASNKATTSSPLASYNLTLVRRLCFEPPKLSSQEPGKQSLDAKMTQVFEVPGNVMVVQSSGPRRMRFRLEWRTRSCGGSQQVGLMVDGLRFDERLNLTSWQASRPIECLWSLSTSVGRLLELDLNSDMRTPGLLSSSSSDASSDALGCDDASLTLYDGLSFKAPVLYRNCRAQITHESVVATSGHVLVRYFSSGRRHHAADQVPPGQPINEALNSAGRSFNIFGWTAKRDGCLRSVLDSSTSYLQLAGSRSSPKYPDLYEARPYKCTSLVSSQPFDRLRFFIDELDIAPQEVQDGGGSSYGFLDESQCRSSGNYLQVRGVSSEGNSNTFCGKFDRSQPLESEPSAGLLPTSAAAKMAADSLRRSTFVVDNPSAWLEFRSKGTTRGRWKISYERLCGSSIMGLSVAQELATPNYPNRPQWPAKKPNLAPHLSEHVCVWRINTAGSEWHDWVRKREKLHFNLLNFVETEWADKSNKTRLPTLVSASQQPGQDQRRDCLRVYEGLDISLRTGVFNLTELDARYEPKLRVCSRSDLKYSSLYYVSQGTELFVVTSGELIAKFRIRPYESLCGGDFMLGEGEFASPNYPQPYGESLDCHYFVYGTPGSRIRLRFDQFDLPVPQESSDSDSGSGLTKKAQLQNSCDSTDYVELRQISTRHRVMIKLGNFMAAHGEPVPPNSDQFPPIHLEDFLHTRPRSRGDTIGSQTTNSPSKNETTQLLGQKARLDSLDRLLERAHLFYLFDENYSGHHATNRVRGQNSRLSIDLETFYKYSKPLGRFCGKRGPSLPKELLRDEILVRFRSHSTPAADGEFPAASSLKTQPARGFLAQYKLEYGGLIKVVPADPAQGERLQEEAEDSSWGLISSPSYPDLLSFNSTITWTFETKSDHVLEFDLIGLSLGSIHRDCQDSLSIFDGLRPGISPQLARLCGQLSYKRLLQHNMAPIWAAASRGELSPRRLPVNLAHEPQVQLNLLRRFRTSSSVATVAWESLQSAGAFLLRYKMVPKESLSSSATDRGNNTLDPLERPLGAEEALAEQFAILDYGDGANGDFESARSSAECSRMFKLTPSFLSDSPNSTDQVLLSSPNWPNEVQAKELECHWLITTDSSSDLTLRISPGDWALQSSVATDGSGYLPVDESRPRWSRNSQETQCFRPQPGLERNFVVVYDGASLLAPVLGRFCLPAPPVQLQSRGRHMLVRYVHSLPLEEDSPQQKLQQSTASSLDVPDQPPPQRTSSLFKAQVHVGRCAAQYFILYQETISSEGLLEQHRSRLESAPGQQQDCLYYLFASNQDQVLTIQSQLSEFKWASEPTDVNCTQGDFLEFRDLPLTSDRFEFGSPEAASEGRLLGRFCAGRAMETSLESPGGALVVHYKSVSPQKAPTTAKKRGFRLMVTSGEPHASCPLNSIKLTSSEPYARVMSPNWPHGFSRWRRCKYHLVAPLNQSLELMFVRLNRPQGTADQNSAPSCLDSFRYLDDNRAPAVRHNWRPLRTLDQQLRQLVQEVACRPARAGLLADGSSSLSAESFGFSDSPQDKKRLVGPISSDQFAPLWNAAQDLKLLPPLKTTSHNLLLEYVADSLGPNEGFLAVVRLSDLPPERKCGGEVQARPDQNLLESASFGRRMEESEAHIQCEWQLKFESASSRMNYIDFTGELVPLDRFPESPEQLSKFEMGLLVFQVLEVPPLVQNTSLFEKQQGSFMETKSSQLCGLNRLLVTDEHQYIFTAACGYFNEQVDASNVASSAWPIWMPVEDQTSSVIQLRTKNLERVVYADWPAVSGDQPEVGPESTVFEGRTKLFRGLRAYFYESPCLQAKRLAGETLAIMSQEGPQSPHGGYSPGVCKWMVRLRPGHYELSFKSLNLRPPSRQQAAAAVNKTQANTSKSCHLTSSPVDYIELRLSSEADGPVLARYCFNNQLEIQKHSIPVDSSLDLAVIFVAGLRELSKGQTKFADAPQAATSTPRPPPTPPTPFGFELWLTKVKNSSASEFCHHQRSFNIFHLIRNRERLQNDRDFFYSSVAPNSLYAKDAHCVIDLAVDDNLRFNFTFTTFFDLEPSSGCKSDYIEISDLVEKEPLLATTVQPSAAAGKPTSKAPLKRNTSTKKPNKLKSTSTTQRAASANTTTSSDFGYGRREIGYFSERLQLYKHLEPRPIGRWCGRNMPQGTFVSNSSKIRITFHSNSHVEGKGFILEWSAVLAQSNRTPPGQLDFLDDDDGPSY